MSKRRVDRRMAGAALLFAALGDATRLTLVQRLSTGPASISTLAGSQPDISRQGVTKHLQVLASAGIIEGRREGREHVWTLNAAALRDAQRTLDSISRDWDDALGRLKRHVERRQDG